MRIHDDTMKIHDLQNDIIPLVVTVKPEHGYRYMMVMRMKKREGNNLENKINFVLFNKRLELIYILTSFKPSTKKYNCEVFPSSLNFWKMSMDLSISLDSPW